MDKLRNFFYKYKYGKFLFTTISLILGGILMVFVANKNIFGAIIMYIIVMVWVNIASYSCSKERH